MNNEHNPPPILEDLIQEHYEDNGLSPQALERLRALGAMHGASGDLRPASPARRWAIVGAIAATLAIAVLGASFMNRPATSPAVAAVAVEPRLIAVQIHADWCARSPEVAPVFADLLTEYGNEPVLFVTLDITDDVRREQARLLTTMLGIPSAFAEPFQSGMIKLIDRENQTLLAAITGSEQAAELEIQLAEVLGKRERDGA